MRAHISVSTVGPALFRQQSPELLEGMEERGVLLSFHDFSTRSSAASSVT